MNASGMTARRLRIVLILIMFVIGGAAGVGFFIAQRQLSSYATAITRLNANAQSGDQSIQTLQQLKAKLQEEAPTIERTRSFVADSSTYNDRVISDLNRIANTAGVAITGFSFDA